MTWSIENWKSKLAAMRADDEYVAASEELDARRRHIGPEIAEYLRAFLDGQVPLTELRATLDTKTRTVWDTFGIKGLSGAMFLNTIVKHLPDRQEEAESLLRACLVAPRDEADARAKIVRLVKFVEEAVARGESSKRKIQSSRTPFFLSVLWHVQDLSWPPFYQSMRECFEAAGWGSVSANLGDQYVGFVQTVRRLETELGCDGWCLEHLCSFQMANKKVAATASEATDTPGTSGSGQVTWVYSPGPQAAEWERFRKEGVAAIDYWRELGDLSKYSTYEALLEKVKSLVVDGPEPHNHARACWEFAHVIKPGDRIFAKRGRRQLVGAGVVRSAYRFDPSRPDYAHLFDVDWSWAGAIERDRFFVMKTLTNISQHPALCAELEALVSNEADANDDESDVEPTSPPYLLEHAAAELFLDRDAIEKTLAVLRRRKNIVLQGPPGVGKTFVASRLASLLVGRTGDPDRIAFVQFHPSYSYEDFVQGYRPQRTGGFELREGPFLRLVDRALQDPDEPYVLIVDEINRGNLGKIFGELLMLLESDKRHPRWGVSLAYSGPDDKPFHIPDNVYVIGTMNTADRSLALVDYALRRRFSFIDLPPAFESDVFAALLTRAGADADLLARIRRRLAGLNAVIKEDLSLGDGYLIGHSHFCPPPGGGCDDGWFEEVVTFEIEPLLREYWFDNPKRAEEAALKLLADD